MKVVLACLAINHITGKKMLQVEAFAINAPPTVPNVPAQYP